MYHHRYMAGREKSSLCSQKSIKSKYMEPRDYTRLTQNNYFCKKTLKIKSRIS